jgi:hypothetical protein
MRLSLLFLICVAIPFGCDTQSQMSPYANRSGDSGVVSYATDSDSITVRFRSGESYTYTYESAGQNNVEQMKRLAHQGKGLSTFVSRNVKNMYDQKRRDPSGAAFGWLVIFFIAAASLWLWNLMRQQAATILPAKSLPKPEPGSSGPRSEISNLEQQVLDESKKPEGPPTYGIPQPSGTIVWGGGGRVLADKAIRCPKCNHMMSVAPDITECPCEKCGARMQLPIVLL